MPPHRYGQPKNPRHNNAADEGCRNNSDSRFELRSVVHGLSPIRLFAVMIIPDVPVATPNSTPTTVHQEWWECTASRWPIQAHTAVTVTIWSDALARMIIERAVSFAPEPGFRSPRGGLSGLSPFTNVTTHKSSTGCGSSPTATNECVGIGPFRLSRNRSLQFQRAQREARADLAGNERHGTARIYIRRANFQLHRSDMPEPWPIVH